MSEKIARLDKSVIDMVYPVGAIYMSVNSTNPGNLFGGKWEQIKDRFMLACGDTYAAGSTGGEAQHTLTVDEMPAHEHPVYVRIQGNEGWPSYTTGDLYRVVLNVKEKAIGFTLPNQTLQYSAIVSTGADTGSAGSSKPHNNMPPYLTVYMWKRTA